MPEYTVVFVLLIASASITLAAEPQPIHVWHFDETEGDLLLDAGRDFADIELREGASRVEGRFGTAVRTGGGGNAQGGGLGMIAGAVEAWVGCSRPQGTRSSGWSASATVREQERHGAAGRLPSGEEGKRRASARPLRRRVEGVSADPPSLNEWHHLAANWGRWGCGVHRRRAGGGGRRPRGEYAARRGLPRRNSWGRHSAVIDEVRIYAEPLPGRSGRGALHRRLYVAEPAGEKTRDSLRCGGGAALMPRSSPGELHRRHPGGDRCAAAWRE